MSDDLKALADLDGIIAGLLSDLSPGGRAQIMKKVARDWGKSQSVRIKDQKNPDGSAFEPRKPQPRLKEKASTPKARRKTLKQKKMFRKLRMARYLKSGASSNEAWVGFVGRISSIARVHQDGLKDRPVRGAEPVQYPMRELLGLTIEERETLLDSVIKHLEP